MSSELFALSSSEKKEVLQRFFKTKKGEYGAGDIFIGVTVPQLRAVAKKYKEIRLDEVVKLLSSSIHEERLVALYMLIGHYKKGDVKIQKEIFELYIRYTKYINNWDLVDSSAEFIVGDFLGDKEKDLLFVLAKSESLWERRIAIVATFCYIKKREHHYTFEIANLLLGDKEDLIHKAVGWMLREVGKRCGEDLLRGYLDRNSSIMARTTLRYAIEKFTPELRRYYLQKDKSEQAQ